MATTTTVERSQSAQEHLAEAQATLRDLQAQRKAAPATYNQAVARADSAAMVAAKRAIGDLDEQLAAATITVAQREIEALEERRAAAVALADSDTSRREIAEILAEHDAAKRALEAIERRYAAAYGQVQAASGAAVSLEAEIRDARARLEALKSRQMLAV